MWKKFSTISRGGQKNSHLSTPLINLWQSIKVCNQRVQFLGGYEGETSHAFRISVRVRLKQVSDVRQHPEINEGDGFDGKVWNLRPFLSWTTRAHCPFSEESEQHRCRIRPQRTRLGRGSRDRGKCPYAPTVS
ncbi:hypothetical protein NPIL_307691 [Nephila pilipes]|uniref:Uncharacterized protein n=1 Tax=Nephila pilipes TaxID=299642 RepID=A0A8X6P5S8_NEPPI|nr:hypothetical protein NPIL_307691 [Nephila pilipes]